MKKFTAAIGASLLAMALATPASAAPLLNGHRVGVQYYFPTISNLYEDNGSNLVGTDGPTNTGDGYVNLFFTDTTATADYLGSASWTSTVFNGFRLYDFDGDIDPFTSVTLGGTNLAGLTNANISFDTNNIYVNWQGLSFDSNTFATFNINGGGGAVPETATWAMMILGMGMIGAAMRRRQSVRVTYA